MWVAPGQPLQKEAFCTVGERKRHAAVKLVLAVHSLWKSSGLAWPEHSLHQRQKQLSQE